MFIVWILSYLCIGLIGFNLGIYWLLHSNNPLIETVRDELDKPAETKEEPVEDDRKSLFERDKDGRILNY